MHFDGLPRHAGDDITRPIGLAVRHVLHRRHHHVDVQWQVQGSNRLHGAQCAGGATHVKFHLLHEITCFERNAAGVKGHPFADQRVGRLTGFSAAPAEVDQARAVGAALRHRQQAVHVEFRHRLIVENLHTQLSVITRHGFGGLGQFGWGAQVGWHVAQIATQLHASRHRLRATEFAFGIRLVFKCHRLGRRWGVVFGCFGGTVNVVAVRQCQRRLAQRPVGVLIGQGDGIEGAPCGTGSRLTQLLAGRHHGTLEGDAVEFSGFAEACDQ